MNPIENAKEELEKANTLVEARKQNAVSFLTQNKKTISVVLVALLITTIFTVFGFVLWKIFNKVNEPTKPFTPAINLSLDGKKSSVSDPQVVYVQGQNTVTKEISYIAKEIDSQTGIKEPTDVQFETKDKKVYVKVNGRLHEVPIEVTEDSKFENGKLVVAETTKTDINITGPDPAQWSLSYLRNLKGEQAAGISYGLNKVVRADLLFVQNKDPFIGVTVSLGDLQSRSAPKTVAREPEKGAAASKGASSK